jgi:hypothetical protein
MTNKQDDDDDDKVGYGRPPKHSRFKPGQSGNPKGRRKGTNNFRTDVRKALRRLVTITRNGRPHKISTQEAALLTVLTTALKGNRHSLESTLKLAAAYNNDTGVVTDALSTDDAAILEVYRARILSGAAESAKTADTDRQTVDDSHDDEKDDGDAGA